MSCGDRCADIEELKKEHTVIIDDMDLASLESENCLYCHVCGFIDGHTGYKIHNFLN